MIAAGRERDGSDVSLVSRPLSARRGVERIADVIGDNIDPAARINRSCRWNSYRFDVYLVANGSSADRIDRSYYIVVIGY